MSKRLSNKKCDVTKLFDTLWKEAKQHRVAILIQNQPDKDKLAELIKRKTDDFLRTFPIRDRLKLQPDTKDNAKALAARNRGNELFVPMQGKYLESLQHYNESIAYSEPGSEARALAYGNRSVVCLKLGLSQECLENIRLARASNYPARLMNKLNKREQDVKRCIENDAQIIPRRVTHTPGKYWARETGCPALQLSYEAHAHIPHLAKCVELRQNSQYGRHLVTTQHLKAGDVFLIEKPYANLLCDTERYKRCAFCQNEDTFTLIPCEGCTVTMYCSKECMDKAHKQYHRYECGVLRDCWRIVGHLFGGMVGLRTVATAIASFDQDLEGLAHHLNTLDEANVNAFTVDWNEVTDSDMYDTVHVLATNQKRRGRKDLSKLIFFTSIVHLLLLERTDLGPLCESNPARSKLLFDLLLRHVQTSLINKKGVYHMTRSKDDEEEDEYEDNYFGYDRDDEEEQEYTDYGEETHAIAVYPLFSMVNHSCIPNVAPIHLLDGRCAFVANRPIAAGEQLFDVYDFLTMEFDPSFRRYCLKQSYFFNCRCPACQSGWPMPFRNKSLAEEHFLLLLREMDNVVQGLPRLVKYMNQAGRHYPKHQITAAEVILSHTLRMIHSYSPVDDMLNEMEGIAEIGLEAIFKRILIRNFR